MPRQISDSERLVIAALNRKETENKQLQEKLSKAYQQLKTQAKYISELKESNQMLAAQLRYLISNKKQNA